MNGYLKTLMLTTALALPLATPVLAQQSAGTTGATSGTTGMGGTSAQSGTTSAMSEDTIRSMLKGQGYSDLDGLKHDGNKYTIKSADRYGKKVKDIDVDAQTGQVKNPAKLSEDQVKDLLKQRGYSDVSDVKKDGDNFKAEAKQAGRDVKLKVDGKEGIVTPQNS